MKNYKYIATLPTETVEKVRNIFPDSKAKQDHACLFIDILIRKSFYEFGRSDRFIEIPKNYFRKVFSGHYQEWLSLLIDSNIVTICNSYSTVYNRSKRYKYNIYISPFYVARSYSNYTESVVIKRKDKRIENPYFLPFVKDVSKLTFDFVSLYDIARKKTENLSIEPYLLKKDFGAKIVKMLDASGGYRMVSVDDIWKFAKQNNKKVFYEKGIAYLDSEEDFLFSKKESLYTNYMSSIDRIKNKSFYAGKNSTNNRLDTNFTNLSREFTDFICFTNDLVQIDLCCSQFAILSHTLDLASEDFLLFKGVCKEGRLYEFVQEKLKLISREEAKEIMFQCLFSDINTPFRYKNELKLLFPSVTSDINKIKKEKGYKNFSIDLQKRESEIFIDNLWTQIKKTKKFCLTKHDSLIVKKEDLEDVMEIICSYFKEINFEGKLSIN